VATDSRGHLWISTAGGLNSLDPATMQFTRWAESIAEVGYLLVDGEDRVWFGAFGGGVFRLDPGTGVLTDIRIELPPAPGDSFRVNKFYEDTNGRIWLGLPMGLIAFDPGIDEPVLAYTHDSDDAGTLPAAEVITALRDDRGALWVGTVDGLAVMEPGANSFHRLPAPQSGQTAPDQLQDGVVTMLHQDRRGNLWVGTARGGLHLLVDRERYRFQPFRPDPADPYSLGGMYVWGVLEDSDGLLHFAAGGLSTLDPDTAQFASWAEGQPDVHRGIGGTASGAGMAIVGDRVWLGDGGGIHGLDPVTGDWTTFRLDQENTAHPQNRVHALSPSSRGGLWVGLDKRLAHFHPAEGYTHVTDLDSAAVSIRETRDGVVWAGAIFSGLARYEPESGEITYYRPRADEPGTISHTAVWSIEEDHAGNLWLGTQGGLDHFDRVAGQFRRIRPGSRGVTFPSEEIRDLAFNDDGTAWVATAGGLVLLDLESGEIRHTWTAADGFPSNPVYRVQADGVGGLWLATSGGLARLDEATHVVRPFTIADGLLGEATSSIALDSTGRAWIRSNAGLMSVEPARLGPPAAAPRLVSTQLLIDGEPLAWSATGLVPVSDPQLAELRVDHRERVLRLRFSALDYGNPARVLYQYRMPGLDADWNTLAPGERSIIYTTLPTGTHQLQVRARNRDGVWSTTDRVLGIRVAPPPWLTWPAYLAYALAAVLAFSLLLAWRTQDARARARALAAEVRNRTLEVERQKALIERQATALERELDSKNRLFADVSHEFRTPLTLISGSLAEAQGQTLDAQAGDRLAVASRATLRLERLVDQLLDLARLDAGQPVPRDPQPLGAEIKSQVEAFRALADEKGVELVIGTVAPVWVGCGADPLEKMVSNVLSNAVKFSRPGDRVTVEVRAEQGFGVLVVADTGPGMTADVLERVFERFHRGTQRDTRNPGAGIGLALVKRLAEACGGQVEMESKPGAGTRVSIRLPLAEPALAARPGAPVPPTVAREIQAAGSGPLPVVEPGLGDATAHLLVVEDSPELAAYIGSLLAGRYTVELASDGERALERARATVPDLVVCDAMLPGIDGFEVCERLKADTLTSHVPVLMLTARADKDSRREAFRRHADDFLTKPFDREELLQRITNLLEIRALLRERFGRTVFVEPSVQGERDTPDQRFLDRLTRIIEKRYSDPGFEIGEMAAAVAMSERQLQRKLKAITNNSPMEYLRLYRLERAKERLAAGNPAGQVAMDTGFTSASYFGKCYRARYGVSPRKDG
jgi:signal transduction histidine kinase/DNA-binding response OmpR family regulator/ligand-binding sensor domain-containing protein